MLNTSLEQTRAYLLLGGNLGARESNLQNAITLIANEIGEVEAVSALYETAAWGKTNQPDFLNQALVVLTSLSAVEVLDQALRIESVLGRIRYEKWGERLIDIDLILYGQEIIQIEDRLQVPHPRMHERRFVMAPMAEIAPDVMHPVTGKTMLEILSELDDNLEVKRR